MLNIFRKKPKPLGADLLSGPEVLPASEDAESLKGLTGPTANTAEMPKDIDNPVQVVARVHADDASNTPAPQKRSRGPRLLERFRPSVDDRITKKTDVQGNLPIRVVLGYLPEVSVKDAREYAQGVAKNHFEQLSLTYVGAFKCDKGYVYEAHEGGNGKAFTPEILEYFNGLKSYATGEQESVVIKTATRYVEVIRMREGLTSVLYPEASEPAATEWLVGGKQLSALLNRRTRFFGVSSIVFVTGVLAFLLSGAFFRLQPFDTTVSAKREVITTTTLPRTQWSQLVGTPSGFYVKALRFQNGKWLSPEMTSNDAPSEIGNHPPLDALK